LKQFFENHYVFTVCAKKFLFFLYKLSMHKKFNFCSSLKYIINLYFQHVSKNLDDLEYHCCLDKNGILDMMDTCAHCVVLHLLIILKIVRKQIFSAAKQAHLLPMLYYVREAGSRKSIFHSRAMRRNVFIVTPDNKYSIICLFSIFRFIIGRSVIFFE